MFVAGAKAADTHAADTHAADTHAADTHAASAGLSKQQEKLLHLLSIITLCILGFSF